MNEETVFVRAIAEAPHDETLVSIFADWLEERGDQRGPWVRHAAVRPWMGPDFREPLPAIVDALAQNHKLLAIRRAVVALGAPAASALIPLLQHENPSVRYQTARCLLLLGKEAREAVPALMAALHDSKAYVRFMASQALKAVGNQQSLDALMGSIWERIHTWLEANAPIVLASLGPPATNEQFAVAEEAMGVVLPEEVKACYRVHDGQRIIHTPVSYCPELHCTPGFLYGEDWFSLHDMTERWRDMKGLLDGGTFAGCKGMPQGPIRSDWWHPKWVPLTHDHSGYMRCLDLSPRARGQVGQVIYWCHDDAARGVLARSFTDYLEQFASSLERGQYTTAPDKHGPNLIHIRDL